MDEFARPFADDVNAEELPGFGVKDQFEEAGDIAEDLAARDLLIAGFADLVRDRGFGEFLFVLADHRDFRDRIDPVRKPFGSAAGSEAEGMADGEAALLHR